MATHPPYRIRTVSQYHQATGLPKPEHPLISVINLAAIRQPPVYGPVSLIYDFYCIALKRNPTAKYTYGQQAYDFDEGILFFMSPGQVFGLEIDPDTAVQPAGWVILIHPDFLWNTPLAQSIKHYDYFGYSANEALCLSGKEEKKIISIIKTIQQEYRANIDEFSQGVIIAQLTLLFSYAERFYHRQFITRKLSNHQLLNRLDDLLFAYFEREELINDGLPTVDYVAERLNVSPNYLRGLLKRLSGQNTQQYIHGKLIEKAKEKLSTTDLSVSEIAYALGFKHTQSFSKLFRSKTDQSPLAFRQSFN